MFLLIHVIFNISGYLYKCSKTLSLSEEMKNFVLKHGTHGVYVDNFYPDQITNISVAERDQELIFEDYQGTRENSISRNDSEEENNLNPEDEKEHGQENNSDNENEREESEEENNREESIKEDEENNNREILEMIATRIFSRLIIGHIDERHVRCAGHQVCGCGCDPLHDGHSNICQPFPNRVFKVY